MKSRSVSVLFIHFFALIYVDTTSYGKGLEMVSVSSFVPVSGGADVYLQEQSPEDGVFVNVSEPCVGDVSPGYGEFVQPDLGEAVTLSASEYGYADNTAYRCAGCVVERWNENCWSVVETNETVQVQINYDGASLRVTWLWEQAGYKLEASGFAGDGTVDADPLPDLPGGYYSAGTEVTLTAVPTQERPSAFEFWTGDVPEGAGGTNPLALEMDGAKTITAVFSRKWELVSGDAGDTITDGNWVLNISPVTGGGFSLGKGTTTGNAVSEGSGYLFLGGVEEDCGVQLVSVNAYAFKSFDGLLYAELPQGLTSVMSEAFRGAANLVSVVLPDGLLSIGNGAFQECTSLNTVTPLLPSSLNTLGTRAFDGCVTLSGVLKSGLDLEVFSNYSFRNVKLIKEARLTGVKTIGESSFDGCSSLTNVVVTEGVLYSIGWAAFKDCSSLVSFCPFFPRSLSSLAGRSFTGCKKLSGSLVILNPAVTKVQDSVFSGNSISSAYLPYVQSIGNSAFSGGKEITNMVFSPQLHTLEWGAFANCPKLEHVEPFLPDTLKTIAGNVFSGCTSLRGDVMLNNENVCKLDSRTFINTQISSLTATNVVELDSYAVCNNPCLTNIVFSRRVSKIGEQALAHNPVLKSISADMFFPELSFISYNAFSGCSSLGPEIVLFCKDLSRINSYAFSGCSSLRSISLPEKISEIGEYTFYKIAPGAEIYFTGGAGLTRVGYNSFAPGSAAERYTIFVPVRYDPSWKDYVMELTDKDRQDASFPGEGTIGIWPTAYSNGIRNWVKNWTSPLEPRETMIAIH